MNAKEVFSKTLIFGWIKLGIGLLNILIALALFALLIGISYLFKSGGVGAILFFVWLGVVGIVNFFMNHYIGYLVKAGHVAVIVAAFQTNAVPADPVHTGKAMVKERFGTSNVYFIIDKLIAGSVKQLQRTLGRLSGGLFDAIPGTNGLKNLMNLFLDISLGYIDECCLGYTFNHPEQNAFKSAADGVAIYFKNWKTLLKDAAKTAFTVIISVAVITLIAFVLFGGLFRLFEWSGFVAFVISLLLAWTVKYAFVDSWILVKMMSSYMQIAPTTQITFDLYGKLCGWSTKFKELWQKGGGQTSLTPVYPLEVSPPTMDIANGEASVTRFCPDCGAQSKATAAFCGSCGAKTNFA
ncbi:MAG: zinc ribbon domain-containing protein [Candidatus Azobacteroides sp.]|nr:zinc ribbon domain-containing protein [Candidatus Azobacteroides sp.]